MSFDPSKPVKTDNYDTGFLTTLRANILAAAMWLDTATAGTVTGPVAGMKRFNATTKLFEQHDGSVWAELVVGYVKNVAPTTYGTLRLSGATGGWQGLQFTGGAKTWNIMVNATDGSGGFYNLTDGLWIWNFDGSGALAAGTVPWARVTGVPAITGLTADANPTANTVARRDASGYLWAAYFNQGSGNNENPTVSQVMVTNGSDGYLRKASLAHLGNSIAVPWANVSGRPTALSSFSNDSGYITSAPLASYAALSSGPQFYGQVRGNGGTKGLGAITTTTTTGTPTGGSDGDVVFVY